uniref:Uncharacterized protein n=1 Tax=Octopus bimaculoides TaxID=37653 RepID=A0A0L8I6W9_OCTBM
MSIFNILINGEPVIILDLYAKKKKESLQIRWRNTNVHICFFIFCTQEHCRMHNVFCFLIHKNTLHLRIVNVHPNIQFWLRSR